MHQHLPATEHPKPPPQRGQDLASVAASVIDALGHIGPVFGNHVANKRQGGYANSAITSRTAIASSTSVPIMKIAKRSGTKLRVACTSECTMRIAT